MPEHRYTQNADHFAHNSPFSAFFTKVVRVLGAAPPQVAASLPSIGGNCTIRGTTRRRHAVAVRLVVQNPLNADASSDPCAQAVGPTHHSAQPRQMSHAISDCYFEHTQKRCNAQGKAGPMSFIAQTTRGTRTRTRRARDRRESEAETGGARSRGRVRLHRTFQQRAILRRNSD